jgi:hypothetical protein
MLTFPRGGVSPAALRVVAWLSSPSPATRAIKEILELAERGDLGDV